MHTCIIANTLTSYSKAGEVKDCILMLSPHNYPLHRECYYACFIYEETEKL